MAHTIASRCIVCSSLVSPMCKSKSVALLQSILRHLVGFSGNNDAILYCFTLWSKPKQARESMNTPGQLTLSAFTRFHHFCGERVGLSKTMNAYNVISHDIAM